MAVIYFLILLQKVGTLEVLQNVGKTDIWTGRLFSKDFKGLYITSLKK